MSSSWQASRAPPPPGAAAALDRDGRRSTFVGMRGAAALLLLLLAAGTARAECVLPDRRAEAEALFAALAAAPDARRGAEATAAVWRFWFTAPDAVAQSLLSRGGERMRSGDFAAAEALFAELVAWCPGYAEGWNQRAFARYLRGDDAGSLADIAEVLAREPRHFGALAGKAAILHRLGRRDEAARVFAEARAINPWLGPAPGEPI